MLPDALAGVARPCNDTMIYSMSNDLLLRADDVAEIIAILDGTPSGSIDVRTSRFALNVMRSTEIRAQGQDRRVARPNFERVTEEGDTLRVSDGLFLSAEDAAEIIAILDRTPYAQIDIHTRELSLSIARSGEGWTQELILNAPAADHEAANQHNGTGYTAAEEAAVPGGLGVVRPPLPGTFYRAPQPGTPPFVDIGHKVAPDTVVGIMETMKLMTPIHAGVAGTVSAIFVNNGTLVDFETVLMRIEPVQT